jgi:hypothetical protein
MIVMIAMVAQLEATFASLRQNTAYCEAVFVIGDGLS